MRRMRFSLALLAALAIAVPPQTASATSGASSPQQPARETTPEPPQTLSKDEEPKATLEVHYIDVGQGDAMLIRSPAGKTVLIDAGNVGAGGAVNDYLDSIGVTTLDLAIVSHPHLDHMGGMLEVLERHRPNSYMDPGFNHPIDHYAALLEWVESNQIPSRTALAGRKITLEPGIVLHLLAPELPHLAGTRSDTNSNSIVMRLTYGDVSFLFTGDAEDETEQRVMRFTEELASTVLKVAHHGGRHSTSDTWLRRVQPTYAVISAGARNRYKHPTKETLGRLAVHGAHVYRTDQHGDVIARTDGRQIKWETTGERSAKLDEPGGKSSYSRPKSKSLATSANEMSTTPETSSHKELVDLNAADVADLVTLPGIGPKTAERIIEDRAKNGFFPDLAALMRIKGIGPKTVEGLENLATAGQPRAPPPATLATHLSDAEPDQAILDITSRRLLSTPSRVNINTAPADVLAEAGHIATDQALRVVEHRQANGPFLSIDDLRLVVGLQPDAREALERYGTVELELNRATHPQLVALGLKGEEADAIVEHRKTQGDFKSVEELEDIEALTTRSRELLTRVLTVSGSH